MKLPCIYMMCNRPNGTIYVGVTSDLVKRAWQHRTHAMGGFTAKYVLGTLVWYERCDEMAVAIAREKQLKGGPRAQKIALIEAINPTWRDLYNDIL